MIKRIVIVFVLLAIAGNLSAQDFPFPLQSIPPAPDFDSRAFYQCAYVGCTIAATLSWMFPGGGPAAFAAGCTGVMLSCAAKAGHLLNLNNPAEVAAFLEVFQGLCARQVDTIATPQVLPDFGSRLLP